ncbi:GNAT family N-acetyltransferase [Chryseobacterium sp. TY4]
MYKIVNISESTIDLYNSCFAINGNVKTYEKIKWQFLETPVNKQFVDIAVDEENNRVAAIYAIAPVQFVINSTIATGAQSLDTITDENYRGKGLFIKLAKDVYDKAATQQVKLVYGFPNGSSIHGFQKKLNWDVLDPVPFLLKPLKTKYFTNKIGVLSWLPNINIGRRHSADRSYKIIASRSFPNEVNQLWLKFSKDIKVAVNRDKQYLDWRYVNKPDEDYIIRHIYKNDDYLGYVVFCIKEKHGGKVAYIMELIYDLENQKVGEELVKNAVNEIINQDADCILSWCLEHSPNFKVFKKYGFYNMPEKLRPIELHFGACAFEDALRPIVGKRESWYLSYSDSDTV